MKWNKLILINYLTILFYEILFKTVVFKNIISINTIYLVLFSFLIAQIITFFTKIFNDKINKINFHVIWAIISLLFISEYIYFTYYNTVIGLSALEYTSQVMAFKSSILQTILSHAHVIILFIVPNVLLIFLRKYCDFTHLKLKNLFINMLIFICLLVMVFISLLFKENSNKEVLIDKNNTLLTTDRFGLLTALNSDIFKKILKFEDNSQIVSSVKNVVLEDEDYNVTEINFDELIENETDENIKAMHNYFKNITPTKQNKYTGMFEGKNLIVIVAEAFYPIAINETLTPTLYKLSNEGFIFNNFYQPIYGCSTSDGELTSLYSLLPGASTCTMKQTSDKYYPYSYANVLKKEGYKAYAFHGGTYKYYNRNKTLPNLGYEYYACGNGLNINCKSWPQSDVEVVTDSLKYFIKEDKFVTYYMSISGHLEYNFYGNLIAKKNKELVSDFEASEAIKAYMATQIEFDRSLELLISELKKAKKLDDTVIAIMPDHYPYGLENDEITNFTNITDTVYDLYKNQLIIWNSDMEEKIEVDKYASNIDVLPTILNLFGVEYDSRLLIGQDILSDSKGIVMFNNFNWINEYGKYNFATNTFTANKGKKLSEKEVEQINQDIQNKFTMSKLIIQNDYYRKVFFKK